MVSQNTFYQSCCFSCLSLDSSSNVHPHKLVLIVFTAIHRLQARLTNLFNIHILMQTHDV